jgi:V/A-type H+-transporting ATPase subunit I
VSVRPRPARWFELLTGREHLSRVLEVLARTHAVQLQTHSETSRRTPLPELGAGLDEYREAARTYSAFWPEPRFTPADRPREPQKILEDGLAALRAWIGAARPMVAEAQQAATVEGDLRLVLDLMERAGERLPSLALLGGAGPRLRSCLFRLDAQSWPQSVPAGVLMQRVDAGAECYLLAVGAAPEIDRLAEQLIAHKARRIGLPKVAAGAKLDRTEVERLRDRNRARREALRVDLERLSESRDLACAIGDLAFVDWFSTHVPALPATEHFAWVTGWTNAADDALLRRALDAAGAPYLLHFPEAPAGLEPPVTLRNPAWVRPFELFARLLGTPGLTEADPSFLVALIAPVVFGIMFADIGQGAVLLIAGILLRRRYPLLALLIPGGIASMIFGALFGSVFAREDPLHPLWFNPLERPLFVLGLTLGLGVIVIVLGLALDALQHAWARQGLRWLASKAGLLVFYLGVVLAFWQPALAWIAAAGAVWYIGGSSLIAPRGAQLSHALPAAGEFLETVLQVAVNTVSFLRVGAFALAHCGLSSAIVGLASATSSRALGLLVLVVGNVFVIVLEALVVGIQTTRLVLFEFFVRFLRGLGREFRPLAEIVLPKANPYGGSSP